MTGSGIFLLPATLAIYGGISVFGWIFTLAGSLFLALVFARLSRLFVKSGGPYTYVKEGFGNFPGFLVAWGSWGSWPRQNCNTRLPRLQTRQESWGSASPPAGESGFLRGTGIPPAGASPGILIASVLASILVSFNYTRGLVEMFSFIIKLATLSCLGRKRTAVRGDPLGSDPAHCRTTGIPLYSLCLKEVLSFSRRILPALPGISGSSRNRLCACPPVPGGKSPFR